MADEKPAPQPQPEARVKKCPGCGHAVGEKHEKGCIYTGTVTEAIAV